jgi:nitroimidazol reductase NimA-like FMN-containing flavoprotein (pyridoxamine 5'-phosphate oxidase superfamily)
LAFGGGDVSAGVRGVREDRSVIEELDKREIDAFLRRQRVGRVGCHAGGRTYVVPVIYVWDGEYVYVQSIEGRKIQMMRANPHVCFEVDQYEPDGNWRSVILEGTYEELEGGRAEAALALLVQRFSGRRRARTGAPTGRTPVAFRIRCTTATGRRVSQGATTRALTWVGVALSRRRARRVAG